MPENPLFKDQMKKSNLGVVCYNNGIWDFEKRQLFTYEERPDVLPRKYSNHNFCTIRPSDENLHKVDKEILMATLGDDDKCATYLQIIARAMAGKISNKQWLIMCGERNNGKGLLEKMSKCAYGCYVNTVSTSAFLLQQQASSNAAKAYSWAIDSEFTR